LTTYKYGWKTSYYQNTYDNKSDEIDNKSDINSLISELLNTDEEDCETCKI